MKKIDFSKLPIGTKVYWEDKEGEMPLLTTQQLAEHLQKSPWTIRRYVKKYSIPTYAGNRYKLDEFLEAIKEKPKKEEISVKFKSNLPTIGRNQKYRDLLGV